MAISFKKDILPHLIAVITFLIVVFAFYSPVFTDGKVIEQHDILQWEAGAKELTEYRNDTGREGLWTNSMFGGMPGYLVNVEFSGDWLKYIQQALSIGIPHPINQSFLGMVYFYILLLAFGVRPYVAIAGAIAFGLNSFNIINLYAGHNAKGMAIATIPFVMAGVKLVFDRKWLLGLMLTSLGLGLHLRVNHLQITYYLFLILLFWGIAELIISLKRGEINLLTKKVALLVVGAIIAIGANFGKIWTVAEYSSYSIRGKSEITNEQGEQTSGLDKEYAFRWSNGISEPLTLIIPNYYGGSSMGSLDMDSHAAETMLSQQVPRQNIQQFLGRVPLYFGDQPITAGAIYAGAISVFLFILGLFVLPKRHVWWVSGIIVFAIMLTWGKNFEGFNNLMFDYLPGYNKFRSVTFAITIPLILIPLTGFYGLESFISRLHSEDKKLWPIMLISVGIAGGFCLLAYVFAFMRDYQTAIDAQFPGWLTSALEQDRQSLVQTDALRSLFFILISFGLIVLYRMKKVTIPVMAGLLCLAIVLDLFPVGKRYLSEDNYVKNPSRQYFSATAADKFILKDESHYRVLNLANPWNEARTSYYHSSLGGYHGAKMGRYQDVIDRHLQPALTSLIQQLQAGNTDLAQYQVLHMLNTKYLVGGSSERQVLTNEYAFGNAWAVSNLKEVATANEEIDGLGSTNLRNTAVVRAGSIDENIKGNGRISLTKYSPDELTYEADISGGTSLGVFSETYYPKGWKAYVDDKETEIYPVNYILRGVVLPEGKHTVRFVFQPATYATGNLIMTIFSLALIALIIFTAYATFKPAKRSET